MINIEEFLDLLDHEHDSPFRLATVDDTYSAVLPSGRPRVTFDGESSLSTKYYPYLGSYTPEASDRVLMVKVGSSYVILGDIT